ncbi:hypothetical protein HED55_10015 [Ochrobactrum haematophilum]|uniref:Uncharacterized protein n=1 Tax=Brucella haematophila TaxID=419474 RepID=A0ABX1DRT8_9HYPH|nr:hypothetical protein [Brucella haematophila]
MAQINWTGKGIDHKWSTQSNWDSKALPGDTDDAVICWRDDAYEYEPLIDTNTKVQSLTLGAEEQTARLEITAGFEIQNDLIVGGIDAAQLEVHGNAVTLKVSGDITVGNTNDEAKLWLHSGAQLQQDSSKSISIGSAEDGAGFLIGADAGTGATTGDVTVGDAGIGLAMFSTSATLSSKTITLGASATGHGTPRLPRREPSPQMRSS